MKDVEEGALTMSWEPGPAFADEAEVGLGWLASGMRRRLRKKVRTSWTMVVSWAVILG